MSRALLESYKDSFKLNTAILQILPDKIWKEIGRGWGWGFPVDSGTEIFLVDIETSDQQISIDLLLFNDIFKCESPNSYKKSNLPLDPKIICGTW